MTLSAIAAMAANRVIGRDGALPWRLPEDLKYFKEKTSGHILIMGRKTFDSFGGRPLPNRFHVVVTRQTDFQLPPAFKDGQVVHSVEEAVAVCATKCATDSARWGGEVFVIGGGELYAALLPQTAKIYLTEIHQDFSGDAKFPELSSSQFREISRDSKTKPFPYDLVVYERRS